MTAPRLAFAALIALSTGAHAQTAPGSARGFYAGLEGVWAEPSKDCSQPVDTWSFGPRSVRAGNSAFELLGIGGAAGAIRVDLASRSNGARVPLSIEGDGGGVVVSGSGIFARLERCDSRPDPLGGDDTITAETLDEPDEGPSTEELRNALAAADGTQESGADPATGEGSEPGADAEKAYDSRLAGAWSGPDGTCDWRFGSARINGATGSYDVVNFSGDPERIGVQALSDEGEPATFTVVPAGSGARLTAAIAGGENFDLQLTRC